MQKYLSLLLQISLFTLGCLIYTSKISIAQVTSDETVNTQVNQNGNVSEITGGEREGDNLFHSFQDFSVGTGNEAAFLNANDIANIFSRVTGGNISNIDGLISANGSANLFLINPAGILFGENARLDVGGSFYGSTADSILFEDGEFSATDLNNPPVLTINAPIGLNLRDQPADIVNRSVVQDSTEDFVGLEVSPGNNLAFIGGDINFEAGDATARGGNIELGGLSAAGTVGINSDGSLSFPESVPRADVNLNVADVDVTGTGGGNITVNARNLNLAEEEFNGDVFGSTLRTGITADSTSPEAQAGDITINATESVALDSSRILNSVKAEGVGNSGDIRLTTPNLSLTNFSSINGDTFGQGNGGLIDINATESITLDDLSSIFISTGGFDEVEGNGGEINITTPNLSLTNFSSINADTFEQGDAGSVNINATESITLDDSFIFISTRGFDEVEGNGGEINITTPNLSLTNDSSIGADTFGQGDGGSIDINATESVTLDDSSSISSGVSFDAEGNGGEINITTPNLSLTNFSSINADNFGQGDGGSVNINATESVTLDGSFSGISSGVSFDAEGNGGEINITTPNLSLTNGSSIDADTIGQGDGGSIDINATESVTLDGSFSGISSGVSFDAEGNGGEINITTPNLSLTNFSSIDADTIGQGDAGKLSINTANLSLNGSFINADTIRQGDAGLIDINAVESVTLDDSEIGSKVTSDAEGNGGNLNITTPNLFLTNGGIISVSTTGQGDAGLMKINVTESTTLDDSLITSSVNEGAEGNGGNLSITTPNLSLTNDSIIFAASSGQGDAGLMKIKANTVSLDNGTITTQALNNANGGNLEIDANVIVAYPNSNNDILASAQQGEGGNININADSLLGIEQRPLNDSTNDINASSQVRGLDGSVRVNTLDVNPVQGSTELPSNVIEAEQTTDQACQANREAAAKNNLIINGKGGVPVPPDQPLTSQNIFINGEIASKPTIPEPIKISRGKFQPAREIKATDEVLTSPNIITIGQYTDDTYITPQPVKTSQASLTSPNMIAIGQYTDDTYTTPEPVKTSQGMIQPARGIKITEDGGVILTSYPTNNAGERIPDGRVNCGQR